MTLKPNKPSIGDILLYHGITQLPELVDDLEDYADQETKALQEENAKLRGLIEAFIYEWDKPLGNYNSRMFDVIERAKMFTSLNPPPSPVK